MLLLQNAFVASRGIISGRGASGEHVYVLLLQHAVEAKLEKLLNVVHIPDEMNRIEYDGSIQVNGGLFWCDECDVYQ